jgi:hypothetical protein
MLVCEIFRDLRLDPNDYTLNCRFPSRVGFINVEVLWRNKSKVWKFKLEPIQSAEASVPLKKKD